MASKNGKRYRALAEKIDSTKLYALGEALQLVKEVITQIGQAARAPPDHTWVIGPTKQGVVYAWTRDCYFFCATSPKGGPALARFLSAYEY